MKLKNSHLIIFTLAGIILMTFLILNMEVKKEVRDVIQENYDKGQISKEKYKSALLDGKLSYWESFQLK